MSTSDTIALASLVATVISVLIAAILARNNIADAYAELKNRISLTEAVNNSRRKALVGVTAVLAIGLLSPYAFTLYSKTRRLCKNIIGRITITTDEFLVNKTTGTIHHKQICSDHLPNKRNQGQLGEIEACPHLHKAKLFSPQTQALASQM